MCVILSFLLSLSLSSCFNEGYVSDDGHAIFGHDQWVQLGLEAIVCKSIGINIYIYILYRYLPSRSDWEYGVGKSVV